jgi:two-component system CheB/CheR fusion protein
MKKQRVGPAKSAASEGTGGSRDTQARRGSQAAGCSGDADGHYRTLFESIDEGFCVIEKVSDDPLDFRYVEANPAFAVQAGRGDVVGKTIREAFPGEPEQWFVTYDTVVRTGEPIRFERPLVTQGRILELYAFRINDDAHRRVGVIFKDITARREAERNRAWLSAIIESSEDAIISKDLDGVITSWNASAERLFGYTADEVLGKPVTILIPESRLHEEPTVLGRIRRGEKVEHYDTVRRRKDGTLVDISLTVSPILDSRGRVIGASKIARDITERRRSEAALAEGDRRKTEFLAMLAHELRNPLAPILESLEVLRRVLASAAIPPSEPLSRRASDSPADLDPVGHADKALDVLHRQASHMVRLVDDLLDIGRISHGKIELRRERVELSSAVYHAVEAFRPLAERRNQYLSVSLPDEPVYLHADATRLAQIIGNLLNNAGKFTDVDGHISLTATRDAVGTGEVTIEVRDSGIGIAPDQLANIFEMFTQVDKSLDRSSTGLGIGLTLVKSLTELHGGRVEARSEGPGQGCEFSVHLPALSSADPEAPPPITVAMPSASPMRVLVVDDNRDSADMLAMLLQFAGHETHTAHDGPGAVEAAARLRPDAILLDIGLPGLNGYAVARAIRERQGDPAPILIALTGWGLDEDRRRSEEAGFDAHIVKPVDEVLLTRMLAELATGRASDDSPQRVP